VARAPKTLLEWNVLFAMGSLMTDDERAANKKLPMLRQGRLMVKAMPKANRVGEFVAMWTVAKHQEGSVNVDRLAEFWDEPVRTMYRRLQEFRSVWGPVGFDTPDRLADQLIAEFEARHERLTATKLAQLFSVPLVLPDAAIPSGVGS
jgi:hypothetical protein